MKATSVRGVLDELADIARRAARGEPLRAPRVRLLLAHGHRVEGVLRDVVREDGEATVVVDASETRFATDVAYVRLDAVIAVTVADAARVEARDPAAPGPPGRLELQRLAVRIYERLTRAGLSTRLELPKPLRDEDLDPLGSLLPALDTALGAVLDDAMGKEALAKVETVRLAVGEEARVDNDGKVLLVAVPIAHAQRQDATTLRKALESAL